MATDTRLDFDELARLEEERRFLLRSLDDLEREHDAGDIDEADYHTLKDDYTRRAVTVLRAIEAGKASFAPHPRRAGRTAIIVVGVALVAVLGGVLMARAAGLRLPGQSASGTISQNSNDLLVEARGLLASGKPLDAIKLYDQVLTLQPDNAEALAYRGWLLYQTGDADLLSEGKQLIASAVAADPKYPDAHFFFGFVKREDGDLRGALTEWDAYLALDPPADAAQAVRQSADQVRAQLGLPPEAAPSSAAVVDTGGRRGCYNRVVTIRIGGGQGFYGDGLGPVPDVLEAGVDYLVCEALAELTLAILQKDRQRDESLGFTRDLPMYIRAALPYVVDGRTRFITNAGGINPVAAGPRGGRRPSRRPARPASSSQPWSATTCARARTTSGCRPMRCSRTRTSAHGRSSTRSTPAPTSSSPDGLPTRRCSSPRWCTSTGGRGTTGIGSPPASWSATCSSAAVRSRAATTRGRGGPTPTRSASRSRSASASPTGRP